MILNRLVVHLLQPFGSRLRIEVVRFHRFTADLRLQRLGAFDAIRVDDEDAFSILRWCLRSEVGSIGTLAH